MYRNYQVPTDEWSWLAIILTTITAVFLLAWFRSFFVVVKQKTAKVIEVFGKFHGVKFAGLHVKPPFPFGLVVSTENLQIRELQEGISVKSLDKAFLKVPVKVQYQVIEERVKEAHYELEDPEGQIKSYIVNTVRGKANQMLMDAIFNAKGEFEDEVEAKLKDTFEKYGYRIVNVLVDDPQPSDELRQAFDKVLASEREKDAAANFADAKKIKMIGEAEAEAASLEIKGEAFKKFRRSIAEGNSEAINEFLKDVEGLEARDVLTFFAGVDTREAIRDAAANKGTVIVVPANYGAEDGRMIALTKALQGMSVEKDGQNKKTA